MTPSILTGSAVPPWSLAVGAMLSVRLGSALSVDLIDTAGPAGTVWLRRSAGALVFLLLARPPLRSAATAPAPSSGRAWPCSGSSV